MKILMLDIETSPCKAYIWGLWQEVTSTSFIEQDWFILCWCAKWLGDKKIISSALPDFKNYNRNSEDDSEMLKKLWTLLDEADVVVTHNGKNFDHRKINARFLMCGMKPPSPFKIVDTLIVAKAKFAFTSNKLGDIVRFLKIGEKIDTKGFELWKKCLDRDKKAWKTMVDYCKRDIELLEKVYLAMLPYIDQHPNFGIYTDEEVIMCPKCGSDDLHFRGYAYTSVSRFHRFVCNYCGGWGRQRINCLAKEKKQSLATNAI